MHYNTSLLSFALAACLLATVASQAQAEATPGPQLKPCTLELVDGRKVEGHLAVQFKMDDHLVVYSPRLATVRSLLKEHVHALTVNGKREELNPKRELTEEDKKLLGQIEWPDEPPAEGRKPAYTSQKWEAPRRLLVWAGPGTSGLLHHSANWLDSGRPAEGLWPEKGINPRDLKVAWLDSETDVLLPAAGKGYAVAYSVRPAGNLELRHLTVEPGATFKVAACRALTGNVWAMRGAVFRTRYTATLSGPRHTLFFNDLPWVGPETERARPVRRGFVVPSPEGLKVAQYLDVRKADEASVTFCGSVATSDDFQIASGTAIVAPHSQLWPGTRSSQRLPSGAVLRLHSGSEFGKAHNATSTGYGLGEFADGGSVDLVVAGRIEAGTPDQPITEDVGLGVSFKNPVGWSNGKGTVKKRPMSLIVAEGAEIVVHTADPKKARLVIGWHRRHNDWFETRLEGYKQMPEEIEIAFLGKPALEHVGFEDVARGGIHVADPASVKWWQNVSFGARNRGRPEELIAPLSDAEREAINSTRWYRRLVQPPR